MDEQTIGQRLVSGLEKLAAKMKRGDVLEVTTIKRVETPDGPMHIREKKLVEPNENGKYEMG